MACMQAAENVQNGIPLTMQDNPGLHSGTASAIVAKSQAQDGGPDPTGLSAGHLVCTRGL